MSFKQMAIQEYDKNVAFHNHGRNEENKRAADEVARKIMDEFGVGATPDPATGTASVEGIVFSIDEEYLFLTIRVKCEPCDKFFFRPARSLHEVGLYLKAELIQDCCTDSHYRKINQDRPGLKTAGQRLADLIQEIAASSETVFLKLP